MTHEHATTAEKTAAKKYAARNYDHLIGMSGFSDKLLTTHFKLYQGYVKNTNALLEQSASLLEDGKEKDPAFAEIRRRLGWEFDGMRLHEHYFDNLGGKRPLETRSPVAERLAASFGSFENWKKDFLATGAMRGVGWAALYHDLQADRLLNVWINEHNVNHIPGGRLVLIMDVWEHAFMADYGADRAPYMEAFFKNIDWDVVADRLQ